MQEKLKALPEVVSIDSFLPLLEFLAGTLRSKDSSKTELFDDPRVISDLFALIAFSPDARMVAHRFLDRRYGMLHLSVKIKNSPLRTNRRHY